MSPCLKAAILVLPIMLVLPGCKTPAPAISHPPIVDLACPKEPDVVEMLKADPSGLAFDMAVREAGDACRQALARTCRWHKERGADVSCPPALRP